MFEERSKSIIRSVISYDSTATISEKNEIFRMLDGDFSKKKSYAVKEVASMISKSPATVYNLVAEGKLVAVRSGKSNRISSITSDSVERYIKGE